MVAIYFSELNTTISAETLATFDPTAATNLTGRTYGTDVDLTCTAANARLLMKFSTNGTDVTADDVTGVWTNTAGAINGAAFYSDAVAINYNQELSNLVFGNKAFVDLFDNEAAVDTDYKAKYDICVSQLNYGGGAASDGVTDATNHPAAVSAVKGILTDATAKKRFDLQYKMAPNTTFTANAACDVYKYNTGSSSFDTTKLTNFTLDVDMFDDTTITSITRGNITTGHALVATDKLMILNPKTGETLVHSIDLDKATILNSTDGTLATIYSGIDFGFGSAGTETVALVTQTGNGANGKVTVTCDASGAITSVVAANHSTAQTSYSAGDNLTFTKNTKTVTITSITALMANELNTLLTPGTTEMLGVTNARFSTTAMAVTGGNGAAEISLVVSAAGVPTGATISTAGSGYVTGADINLTNVGSEGNNMPIVLTFTDLEIIAQTNGYTITSDVKESVDTTNGKGSSPYFTTATTLPVTDPTGTAAGAGAGALVDVEMTAGVVTNVTLSTTSAGTGYDTTGRMVVHNYTDGTVAISVSDAAAPVLMNDIQKAMLNLDVNAGVVSLTSVPVPFEANDILYAMIDITTPTGQTNASAETPTAFTQKSIVKITLT